MSAVVRRLRPASSLRLVLRYAGAITSHRPLIVGIALLGAASVWLSFTTHTDGPAADGVPASGAGRVDARIQELMADYGSDRPYLVRRIDDDRAASDRHRLFVERPLVLLTLSYHAAPIYDLMDQLQPLGVQFIERGINAYACRYFNTCRQDGLLEVINHKTVHKQIGDGRIKNFHSVYGNLSEWQSVDAFVCLYPAATCELFVPFNRSIIIVTSTRYEAGRRSIGDWRRWNDRLVHIASDGRNVVAANNQYDVQYMRYYTGLTPRLLPSRCGYTRAIYNPTRPGFLLGLRRDWEFRDFFVDGINSACKALKVSVQLASTRDLYPTYKWTDLAAHRGIVPLPCQPSMMGLIEQYRMNIPLFLPTKELLLDFQLGESMMLSDVYNAHAAGETLPANRLQVDIPDPSVRLATSIRYWIRFSDWYTTLPHVILYSSFDDLVLRLNHTTLDDLHQVSRRMAEHNAQVADQLRHDWEDILLKVARNSPNRPRPRLRTT